jgi:hypothetical protein
MQKCTVRSLTFSLQLLSDSAQHVGWAAPPFVNKSQGGVGFERVGPCVTDGPSRFGAPFDSRRFVQVPRSLLSFAHPLPTIDSQPAKAQAKESTLFIQTLASCPIPLFPRGRYSLRPHGSAHVAHTHSLAPTRSHFPSTPPSTIAAARTHLRYVERVSTGRRW